MNYPRRKPKPHEVAAALRIGGADVIVPSAPTPRPTNHALRKGLNAEAEARRELHRQGYLPMKSHGSQGAADILAVRKPGTNGPVARAVQVKSHAKFHAWDCNEAVRDFIKRYPVDEGTRREVWEWCRGWIVFVFIEWDGAITTYGREAEAVQKSIDRMMKRDEHGRTNKGTSTFAGLSFRERLLDLEGLHQE